MTSDLAEVIARWRVAATNAKAAAASINGDAVVAGDYEEVTRLLDAAEAAERARNAALKEAEKVAERYAADLNQFDHHSVTEGVVKPIRALRGAA